MRVERRKHFLAADIDTLLGNKRAAPKNHGAEDMMGRASFPPNSGGTGWPTTEGLQRFQRFK
eukprot:11240754-Alexandrium_andersonii.AAC.1